MKQIDKEIRQILKGSKGMEICLEYHHYHYLFKRNLVDEEKSSFNVEHVVFPLKGVLCCKDSKGKVLPAFIVGKGVSSYIPKKSTDRLQVFPYGVISCSCFRGLCSSKNFKLGFLENISLEGKLLWENDPLGISYRGKTCALTLNELMRYIVNVGREIGIHISNRSLAEKAVATYVNGTPECHNYQVSPMITPREYTLLRKYLAELV